MGSSFLISSMNFEPETLGRSVEGARGPGDLGFAPTEAERRPNPPLAIIEKRILWGSFFVQIIIN